MRKCLHAFFLYDTLFSSCSPLLQTLYSLSVLKLSLKGYSDVNLIHGLTHCVIVQSFLRLLKLRKLTVCKLDLSRGVLLSVMMC